MTVIIKLLEHQEELISTIFYVSELHYRTGTHGTGPSDGISQNTVRISYGLNTVHTVLGLQSRIM